MARCSSSQIEEFKKSTVWLDISDELKIWLEDVHSMLENREGDVSSRALDRLGGNAEAIRHFEELPDTLINNIEVERKERELKRETENGR